MRSASALASSLIAVACAYALRGPGGDAIARAAGSGVLSPGRLAEKQRLSGEIDRGEVIHLADLQATALDNAVASAMYILKGSNPTPTHWEPRS